MTSPILSVRNLTTSFRTADGWKPVVRDVSFQINEQETVAIVGESGSGKSVTSLSIMRLLDKKNARIDGEILLGGLPLHNRSEAQMQAIRGNEVAMIFQEPMTSLNPVLKIGRQISEVLKRHRGMSETDAQRAAIELFEKVRIPAAKQRLTEYPHNFSGGMRQRVMIAIALACRPKLLIADEPTTALDVTIQAQILDLLRTLQKEEKMAPLFITHDMGVVAEIADRTLVMFRGDTVEFGDTTQIFEEPKHPYTRALLAAAPTLGSMTGTKTPQKFAIIDPVSGTSTPSAIMPDTVINPLRPVLEVKNLVTRFDVRKGMLGRLKGRVHAVEDVSFSVRTGETLSIVGESGCGKSTTGRSILRLVEPTSGTVLLEGEDIVHMSYAKLRDRRRGIQMIFQDPYASLNPRMRIGDAIAEPLLIHNLSSRADAHAKAKDLMERVGLEASMLDRFPSEFSGGQRQRICIARALALEPKIIIADESVSALDVSVKAQVINLMLDLQRSMGLAYLFISHDMAVVERVSHKVAVMYLGEIVEIGPRASVFENPQHSYTKKLLDAVPMPDPRKTRIFAGQGEELRSPVRAPNYIPATPTYLEIGPEHFVRAEASAAGIAA